MSHRSKPAPKTSAVINKRQPVTSHDGKASVGHKIGTRKPASYKPPMKTISDPRNGQSNGGARPVQSVGSASIL